jgi:hypothetical protein
MDFAPKIEFDPHGFCYKCENMQKLWRSEILCFKGANKANQLSSRLRKFFRIYLNVYPSLKFNIFLDLEGLYVPISQIIVQSLEITMEQYMSKMDSGAFGIMISISLSDHNSFKSVFLESLD